MFDKIKLKLCLYLQWVKWISQFDRVLALETNACVYQVLTLRISIYYLYHWQYLPWKPQIDLSETYMFAWNVLESLIAKNRPNLSRSVLLTHNTKATLILIWVSKILEIEPYGAYVKQAVGRFILQTKI